MAEDYSKTLFNEAGFIVKRMHDLHDRINKARNNPLAWNVEEACYNYQLIFNASVSLLKESWAKLTDDEQKELWNLKDLITKTMKVLPVHQDIYKESTDTKETNINYDNWSRVEKLLDIFENKIQISLEAHGLSNPDVEDDMF